jgi:hypothetical protein
MSHSITALILKDNFDKDKAKQFDLRPIDLGFNLTLFHIDHYYSACWQYLLRTEGHLEMINPDGMLLPTEYALYEIVKTISSSKTPEYAIIVTNYFGGVGSQYANAFSGTVNVNKNMQTINEALAYLGVYPILGLDAFDKVGLDKIRRQPDYLEKYSDLADEYGV